jgi:hypothetical protein
MVESFHTLRKFSDGRCLQARRFLTTKRTKVTKKYFLSFAFLRLSSGQVFVVKFISSFVLFAAFVVTLPSSFLIAAPPRCVFVVSPFFQLEHLERLERAQRGHFQRTLCLGG